MKMFYIIGALKDDFMVLDAPIYIKVTLLEFELCATVIVGRHQCTYHTAQGLLVMGALHYSTRVHYIEVRECAGL